MATETSNAASRLREAFSSTSTDATGSRGNFFKRGLGKVKGVADGAGNLAGSVRNAVGEKAGATGHALGRAKDLGTHLPRPSLPDIHRPNVNISGIKDAAGNLPGVKGVGDLAGGAVGLPGRAVGGIKDAASHLPHPGVPHISRPSMPHIPHPSLPNVNISGIKDAAGNLPGVKGVGDLAGGAVGLPGRALSGAKDLASYRPDMTGVKNAAGAVGRGAGAALGGAGHLAAESVKLPFRGIGKGVELSRAGAEALIHGMSKTWENKRVFGGTVASFVVHMGKSSLMGMGARELAKNLLIWGGAGAALGGGLAGTMAAGAFVGAMGGALVEYFRQVNKNLGESDPTLAGRRAAFILQYKELRHAKNLKPRDARKILVAAAIGGLAGAGVSAIVGHEELVQLLQKVPGISGVGDITGNVGGAIGHAFGGAGEAVGGVGQAVSSADLAGKAGSLAGGAGELIGNTGGNIGQMAGEAIVGAGGNLLGGAGEAIGGGLGAVGETAGNIGGGIGGAVGETAKNAGNIFSGANQIPGVEGAGNLAGGIGGAIGETGGNIGQTIGNIAGGTGEAIGNLVGGTSQTGGNLLGGAGEMAGNIPGVKGVSDLAGGAGEMIGGGAGAVGETAGNIGGGIGGAVGETAKNAGDFARSNIPGVAGIGDVTGGVGGAIGETSGSVGEWTDNNIPGVKGIKDMVGHPFGWGEAPQTVADTTLDSGSQVAGEAASTAAQTAGEPAARAVPAAAQTITEGAGQTAAGEAAQIVVPEGYVSQADHDALSQALATKDQDLQNAYKAVDALQKELDALKQASEATQQLVSAGTTADAAAQAVAETAVPTPDDLGPIPATMIHGHEVAGSAIDNTLTYDKVPWVIVENGTKNINHVFEVIGEQGPSIDQQALAAKIQQATNLYTHGQLNPLANPDLYTLFHLSNGTASVYEDLLNEDTVESLKKLSIIK